MSETPPPQQSDLDQQQPAKQPGSAEANHAPIVVGAPKIKQTERPHPLTPFIRGWIVMVAIIIGFGRELIPDGEGNGINSGDLRWVLPVLAGVVMIAAIAGFFSWYFTRFVIDDEELRIETGALFKNSKRISFERLQSIDVIQPLAARMFGLAELRLEVGSGDSAVKLRYLSRANATQLRDYLLARAHGDRTTFAESGNRPAASAFTDLSTSDKPLVTIGTQRLVGGFLLSSDWLITIVILIIAFIVTGIFQVVPYALPGLIPLAIGGFSMVSKRVIAQFNFTLAESGRGVRITRGLTNLTSQSVPVDRIQGFKISQSILWKRLGWYRVDVDILGYASRSDDSNQGDATSVLLPVATAAEVQIAMTRVLPGVDLSAIELQKSPRRVMWLRPFDGWTLRYGYDSSVIVSENGWLTHVRNVVPHAKTQSVRIEQGPVQRRLSLASVLVDTPKGPVNLIAAHLAPDRARQLAMTQLNRARASRETARLAIEQVRANATARSGEAAVLAHFGIGQEQLLGSGNESRVYALGGERVLRLFHPDHEAPAVTPEHGADPMFALYRSWVGVDIGLEVPQILEIGQLDGRSFTIDRRMSGRDFSGWLAEASIEERRPALVSYLDAAMSLYRLPLPRPGFARLLGDAPQQFASLSDLLNSQIDRAIAGPWSMLSAELTDPDGVIAQLRTDMGQRICQPALVHGDLCPPNAFVSKTPDGSAVVTGVGDFSPHTLAADPMMDVAGAIAFLELENYPGADEDARWLEQVALDRIGPDAGHWIGVYRRFFAVYYSMDESLHPWCLAQLRL